MEKQGGERVNLKSEPILVDYRRAGLHVKAQPQLDCYLLENSDRAEPAVIVLPGGGYQGLAPHEGEPVARRFCQLGCHAFVLHYSCSDIDKMRFPGALLEVFTAISVLRSHSTVWKLDPDRIFVCGFSAGGHLAGCAGTMWDQPFATTYFGNNRVDWRPNGMILSYPVISCKPGLGGACVSSMRHLLKEEYDQKKDYVSLEQRVSSSTVPAFIWHTYPDTGVSVKNSMLFADALYEHHIPLEMHLFPYGNHGLGLGMAQAECSCWIDMAVRWLRSIHK